MSKVPVYQVRFSSYPQFQNVLGRVVKKSQKNFEFRVTRKMIVLAGLLSLKNAKPKQIEIYRKKLKLDKNPNKPENRGALHRAIELTLHDTALAKSLLGHLAFELRIHDVQMRELYHLGIYRLDKMTGDEVATLINAAIAITEELNPSGH